MKLPNHELAQVPRGKSTQYLLNPVHRDGKHKAAFFLQFGFSAERWEVLALALLRHVLEHRRVEETAGGGVRPNIAFTGMKPIRLSKHALEQCAERGTNEQEVREAVRIGRREPAKRGRLLCRANFQYNATWQGRFYAIKQVAPVIVEEKDEIVVVTVYTFYY